MMSLRSYLLVVFLGFTIPTLGQEIVEISDTIVGKRITVYALNTSDTIVNIFFKIEAEGYRKSAERPVIKDLQPNRKTKVATLVKLRSDAPAYDYILVVNDVKPDDINVTKNREYVADIEPLITGKLVIFGHPDCSKCNALLAGLDQKKVAYRSFDINQDAKTYEQFLAFLAKKSEKKFIIRLPFVWNKDRLMSQDLSVGKLIEMLEQD